MPQCTSAASAQVERAGPGERHARPDRLPPSIDQRTGRVPAPPHPNPAPARPDRIRSGARRTPSCGRREVAFVATSSSAKPKIRSSRAISVGSVTGISTRSGTGSDFVRAAGLGDRAARRRCFAIDPLVGRHWEVSSGPDGQYRPSRRGSAGVEPAGPHYQPDHANYAAVSGSAVTYDRPISSSRCCSDIESMESSGRFRKSLMRVSSSM